MLRTLRGEGAGGVSFRGEGVGGSFAWDWEEVLLSTTVVGISGDGLGCLGIGEMVLEVIGVSPGGIKVGLRDGLGGKGPKGRSGSGGRSMLVARTGRLVSDSK